MIGHGEEGTRVIRQLRKPFQLDFHFVHGFLLLFAVHAVQIEVLLAHSFVFILDESRRTHINKSSAQVLI